MHPITGPTIVQTGVAKYPGEYSLLYEQRMLCRQEPPFNLALPYMRLTSRISSFVNTTQGTGVDYVVGNACYNAPFGDAYPNFRSYAGRWLYKSNTPEYLTLARAKNMVYEKFVAELSDKVELLVTLAERREAYSMVETRLSDLYRFVKALRHPNPRQMRQFFTGSALPRRFRDTLKYHLRNWRSSTKDLGRLWLELHFGWEPIVRDIDTSLQLIAKPLPEGEIQVESRTLPIQGTYGYTWLDPYARFRSVVAGSVKCYGSVAVQVDNLDKAYRTVLGLNNPVLVAYSLIPFSWMFDWVNYLGTYISSFSDLAGYTITRASHSVRVRAVGTFSYEYPQGTTGRRNAWSGAWFRRYDSIPSVTLTWRPLPKRLSVIRGVTLASLIAGLLDPRDPAYKTKRS